jgi:RNA polymerase sigma-70 factor (ECF subfamily)
MKAVDRPFASPATPTCPTPATTSTTVDPQAETLRLFQEHGAALYRFCRSVLRLTSDAEDVVQETFLKLLHHLQHDGDTRNLKSWLFTVAANGCRDRTRWRLRWLPWNAERDDRPVDPIDDEVHLKADTTRVARKAFRALAPRDRLLLSLRAQGLSYKDIAAASGIREQSVGRLLARALDRWRKQCVA